MILLVELFSRQQEKAAEKQLLSLSQFSNLIISSWSSAHGVTEQPSPPADVIFATLPQSPQHRS